MAMPALKTAVSAVAPTSALIDGAADLTPDPLLARLLGHWFDQRDMPAFIIQENLFLVGSNAEGRRTLYKRSVLHVVEGKVAFFQAGQTESFRSFLQQMSDDIAVWSSARGDDDRCDVFRVHRLAVAGEPLMAFGVTLVSAEVARIRYWADISAVFPLTPSEQRIAKQLFEGLSIQEISEATGAKIETVRTHIRRIYQKTGVASREKLQSVLSPFQTL